jgi:hypothetical protein
MSGVTLGFLRYVLGMDTLDFETKSRNVERQLRSTERQFRASMERVGQIGQALTASITLPVIGLGAAAVRTASDAQELQSAFNATFGDLADDMNVWAEATGNAMNRSTQEIQRGANAFGLYFNQAAETREEAALLSRQFTVLAQDLASFHNTGVDEALQALRSGLSGETEPMRRYGVFLNDAAVNAQALAMGLEPVNGRLTDQQKIMARQALIMEAAGVAHGDAERTANSAANTFRGLSGATEELGVAVGNHLLPHLQPLVAGLTELVNRFGNLPEGMQRTIVLTAAAAATLGPLAIAASAVGNALAPLAARFAVMGAAGAASAAGTAAAGTAAAGASVGFGALAVAAAPWIAAAAGIAAVGYLIYENWDVIAPVLERIRDTVVSELGPKLTGLFNDVKAAIAPVVAAFTEFWNSSAGEEARGRVTTLLGYLGEIAAWMGGNLIGVIGTVIDVVRGLFNHFANMGRLIWNVVSGDWRGAWDALGNIVDNVIRTVLRIIGNFAPETAQHLFEVYSAARMWLQDRLSRVFTFVTERIEQVKRAFFNLYDAVVGNSYIPDMVTEIGQHMARLEQTLVQPATDAVAAAAEQFRNLQALMQRLFPEVARGQEFTASLALLRAELDAGRLSAEAHGEAVRRLRRDYADLPANGLFGVDMTLPEVPVMPVLTDQQIDNILLGPWARAGREVEATNVRIVESFAQLAEGTAREMQRMVNGIRKGNVVDILGGLLNALDKIGGMTGGFNLGPFRFGQGIAGARALGGPVAAGRNYIVGERGPEIFTAPRNGRIIANDQIGRGGSRVEIIPSQYFDVVVDGRVQAGIGTAAPGIARAGAAGAVSAISRRQTRRLSAR